MLQGYLCVSEGVLCDLTRRLHLIRDDTTDEVWCSAPESRHQVVQLLLRTTTVTMRLRKKCGEFWGDGRGLRVRGRGGWESFFQGSEEHARVNGRLGNNQTTKTRSAGAPLKIHAQASTNHSSNSIQIEGFTFV